MSAEQKPTRKNSEKRKAVCGAKSGPKDTRKRNKPTTITQGWKAGHILVGYIRCHNGEQHFYKFGQVIKKTPTTLMVNVLEPQRRYVSTSKQRIKGDIYIEISPSKYVSEAERNITLRDSKEDEPGKLWIQKPKALLRKNHLRWETCVWYRWNSQPLQGYERHHTPQETQDTQPYV